MNKHAFRSVVLVAIAALNVGVSIVLARLYGPVGAAVGTVLSLLIATCASSTGTMTTSSA